METNRGSGRTMRILLEAAIAVSRGESVAVVALTSREAYLMKDRLESILVRLQIPHGREQIKAVSVENRNLLQGQWVQFRDHTVGQCTDPFCSRHVGLHLDARCTGLL